MACVSSARRPRSNSSTDWLKGGLSPPPIFKAVLHRQQLGRGSSSVRQHFGRSECALQMLGDSGRDFVSHQGCVNTINFDPSGELLVSGSDDRTVQVWDVEERRPLISLKGHCSNVFWAQFLPHKSNRELLSGSNDADIRHYHLEKGLCTVYRHHTRKVLRLSVNPCMPDVFASCSADGTVRLFDLRVHYRDSALERINEHSRRGTGGSDDNDDNDGDPAADEYIIPQAYGGGRSSRLAAEHRSSLLLDFRSRSTPSTLFSVDYHPHDGRTFIVGSADGNVYLFDQRFVRQRDPLSHVNVYRNCELSWPPHNEVTGCVFSRDGREIVSTVLNDHVYVYRVDTNYSQAVGVDFCAPRGPTLRRPCSSSSSSPSSSSSSTSSPSSSLVSSASPRVQPPSALRPAAAHSPLRSAGRSAVSLATPPGGPSLTTAGPSLGVLFSSTMSLFTSSTSSASSAFSAFSSSTSTSASSARSSRHVSASAAVAAAASSLSGSSSPAFPVSVSASSSLPEHRFSTSDPNTTAEDGSRSSKRPRASTTERGSTLPPWPARVRPNLSDHPVLVEPIRSTLSVSSSVASADSSMDHENTTDLSGADRSTVGESPISSFSSFSPFSSSSSSAISSSAPPPYAASTRGPSMLQGSAAASLHCDREHSDDDDDAPPAVLMQHSSASASDDSDRAQDSQSENESESASERRAFSVEEEETDARHARSSLRGRIPASSEESSSDTHDSTMSSSSSSGSEAEDADEDQHWLDEEAEDSEQYDDSDDYDEEEASAGGGGGGEEDELDFPMDLSDDLRFAAHEAACTLWKTYERQYRGHHSSSTIKSCNFFGPNSEYVMSGSDCGRVFIWDKKTGALKRVLSGHHSVVNCLVEHPFDPTFVTSGIDCEVKLWTQSSEFPDDTELARRERNRKLAAAASARFYRRMRYY